MPPQLIAIAEIAVGALLFELTYRLLDRRYPRWSFAKRLLAAWAIFLLAALFAVVVGLYIAR